MLLYRLNIRIGGSNWWPSNPDLKILLEQPVMVVGA